MEIAQIGSVSGAFEGLATAVGAGILLGGFAAGFTGILTGWRPPSLEVRALVSGQIGGALGVVLVLFDLALRYAG